MKQLLRTRQIASALMFAMLLWASPLWGAVSAIKGPTKPVAANGAKVTLTVAFVNEIGPTATVTAGIASDPDGIIADLSGDGTTAKISKGKGNGKVSFRVLKNPTALSRSATLTINGFDVSLNQLGQNCNVTIAPSRALYEFFGGYGHFDVTAPLGCQWSATESSGWLALDSAAGNGNGQVTYTVDENTEKNRSGKIELAFPKYVDPTVRNAGGVTEKPIPVLKKVHTVTQKERKLTGTVKLGPLTLLASPEDAGKAFQACGTAVTGISFLSEEMGGLGNLTDNFTASSVRSAKYPGTSMVRSSSVITPATTVFGITLKKLAPAVKKAGKAVAGLSSSTNATDVSSEICTSGSATVTGLKFDKYGDLVGFSSTLVLTFTDCQVEGLNMNGILTVKGLSFKSNPDRISGTFILGQNASHPLTITENDSQLAAYLSLKMAATDTGQLLTARVQADGIVDNYHAQGRSMVDVKGLIVNMSMPASLDGPTTYLLNGLLRQTYFSLRDEFISSQELRMANFAETIDEVYDTLHGEMELITINGKLGVLSLPHNACIDGTFEVATPETVKRRVSDDTLVDGTVSINGATILMNSDGSKTITANGQTETFSNAEMEYLCNLP